MEEIVSMTAEEIRKSIDIDAAFERAKKSKPMPVPDDGGDWRHVATGFAAFKEYINRKGRPKVDDPKVSISIRIPRSHAHALRATGKGWQTRTSKFLVEEGINKGKLTPPPSSPPDTLRNHP